ncbi:hypothetical protein ACFC37_09780 [Enterococcus durans]|uniref:hypothetical protein n=1 Tax=Enterococcus durans TaxID=53345 RepID=UPI0039A4FFB8
MPIERTDSTILSAQIEDKLLSQVNNFQNSPDFQSQMKWPSSSFVDTPCTSDFHSEHYLVTEEYQLFADLNFVSPNNSYSSLRIDNTILLSLNQQEINPTIPVRKNNRKRSFRFERTQKAAHALLTNPNHSYKEIAKEYQISYTTITYIKKQLGVRSTYRAEKFQRVEQKLREHPNSTYKELKEEFNISTKTIYKIKKKLSHLSSQQRKIHKNLSHTSSQIEKNSMKKIQDRFSLETKVIQQPRNETISQPLVRY